MARNVRPGLAPGSSPERRVNPGSSSFCSRQRHSAWSIALAATGQRRRRLLRGLWEEKVAQGTRKAGAAPYRPDGAIYAARCISSECTRGGYGSIAASIAEWTAGMPRATADGCGPQSRRASRSLLSHLGRSPKTRYPLRTPGAACQALRAHSMKPAGMHAPLLTQRIPSRIIRPCG
jgi:hypothetical protein